MLPLEFRPLETKIASLIGRVFGKRNPKFYVAMDLTKDGYPNFALWASG